MYVGTIFLLGAGYSSIPAEGLGNLFSFPVFPPAFLLTNQQTHLQCVLATLALRPLTWKGPVH